MFPINRRFLLPDMEFVAGDLNGIPLSRLGAVGMQVPQFATPEDAAMYAPPMVNRSGTIAPTMQYPTPDFSPIKITPDAALPSERMYRNMLAQVPVREPLSKKDMILNAIAAGAVGLQQGGVAGLKVARELSDAPYQRRLEEWQNRVAAIAPEYQMDTAAWQRAEKEAELGAKRGTAQSLDIFRGRQAMTGEVRALTGVKKQEEDARHHKMLEVYQQWKMDNPKLDDAQFLYSLEDPQDQLDFINLKKKLETDPKEKARLQTEGRIQAQLTPEGQRLIGLQAGLRTTASTGARIQTEAANAPAIEKTAQAKSRGATTGRLEAQGSELGLRTARSLAEARSQANTLTSNIKDTMAAAQKGLEHMGHIRDLINQMEQEGRMGAYMSKWSDFMAGKVGTDELSAKLRFNIGLMDTLLAKAHGGARGGGSPAMMQHFKSLLSSQNMDAKTLSGVLDEAELWLKGYAKRPNIPIDENGLPKAKVTFKE